MNKVDSILWVERLREALRKLPEDAQVFAWDLRWSDEHPDGKVISIHLSAPIKWTAIFDGRDYGTWTEKRIAVTPHAVAWWSVNKGADDGQEG